MANHRFRSRANRQTFFQFVPARLRHPWQLRVEAFNMILFLLEKALRNEHRKIRVAVPRFLEAAVHFLLNMLPDFKAVRFEHNTAADRRVVHQIRFFDYINIPA
ncbi:hypothetical protein D3C81_1692430 [compost metagenome]